MPKRTVVTFAESALGDLEDILEYYKDKLAPHVGKKLVESVIQHTELIGEHPDMGRIVPEFEIDHLRELIHPPFRIVYRREPNTVRIIRVWRSERLMTPPDA